ncbi:hypothetical protein FRC02_002460 [Tulasnella sp. 418]|nr:hypothetical protein FRC02_002460 [Tulasnella sp. 418]
MATSPSVAAITVAARFPLDIGHTTHIQLSGIGDAPWPNQIWTLESGVHGYRLKNLASAAYLNYIDRKPVMESIVYVSYATEWVFVPVEEQREYPAYHIKPVTDSTVILGCVRGESFNKANSISPAVNNAELMLLSAFRCVFHPSKTCTLEPDLLDTLTPIFAVKPLPKERCEWNEDEQAHINAV